MGQPNQQNGSTFQQSGPQKQQKGAEKQQSGILRNNKVGNRSCILQINISAQKHLSLSIPRLIHDFHFLSHIGNIVL